MEDKIDDQKMNDLIKMNPELAGLKMSQMNQVQPLVDEPYTYENLMNNPIIKPISECDKSFRDIEEMINKRLIDTKRDEAWIEQTLNDVEAYQDSTFIARLLKVHKDMGDVLKFQDIQIKSLKNTIKEMVNIVKEKYGLYVEEEQAPSYQQPKQEHHKKEIDYKGYLNAIASNDSNKLKQEIAQKILKIYEEDKVNKKEKDKIVTECSSYYKDEVDKDKKRLAASLLRMDIEQKEVNNGGTTTE